MKHGKFHLSKGFFNNDVVWSNSCRFGIVDNNSLRDIFVFGELALLWGSLGIFLGVWLTTRFTSGYTGILLKLQVFFRLDFLESKFFLLLLKVINKELFFSFFQGGIDIIIDKLRLILELGIEEEYLLVCL